MGASDVVDESGDSTLTTGGASDVTLVSANGDTLAGNSDGGTLIAAGTGITVDATGEAVIASTSSSATVSGSSNSVTDNAGSDVNVQGGGNDIYSGSSQAVTIGDTNGDFDYISGSGIGAGSAADGNYGLNVGVDSQSNIVGGFNAIYGSSGATYGVYGTGNQIVAGADEAVILSGTDGVNYDYVYSTNDAAGSAAANGQGSGIFVGTNTQAVINGDGNGDYLSSGSTTVINGGASTIYGDQDESISIGDTNGNADTVYTSDDDGGTTSNGQATGIFTLGDSQVDVDGSSNEVTLSGGDDVNVQGGGNNITSGANEAVTIGGTNGTFDYVGANGLGGGSAADGASALTIDANSDVNLVGNYNAVSGSSGDSYGVYGEGNQVFAGSGQFVVLGSTDNVFDTVTASNDASSINLGTDSQANFFGDNDVDSIQTGAVAGIYGGGNTVYGGANNFIVVGNTDNSFDTVNVSNDVSSADSSDGYNSGVYLNQDAQASINGTGNSEYLSSGDDANISGGGNTIYGGADEGISISGTSNNFDIVNVSGDQYGDDTTSDGYGSSGIYISANSQANVEGSSNFVSEDLGDSLGVYGGGNTINGPLDSDSATAGTLLVIGQTGNSIDTVDFNTVYTGQASNGQGAGIVLDANSYATLANDSLGSPPEIANDGDDHVGLNGDGDHLAGAVDDSVGIPQGLTGEVIDASDTTIDIGTNVSATIDGSDDTVHGASSDDLSFDGTDDVAYVEDSTVDFSGSNTGDDVDGSGNSGSDWGGSNSSDSGEDGGDDGYGGYGAYGGYGFSKAPSTTGTNIGVIASYDTAMTDQADAQTAQTARLQAEAALSSTSSIFTPQFESAKWANTTITWSVAGNPNANGAQLSGTIDSQYISLIESAFQTWAAVSGLKFQQVTGSTAADIQLGWSTFNSAVTGVLGYTGFKSLNGSILAGALISLENPADDALTTDANGQLAYTGTQTELQQLILHEIGHALGLADDSDPNSIMYAVLNASNRTLDATDIAGIQTLYEPATVAATTASATAAVTTGLSDIASLTSSNPITVASSLISSLTSSALSPFTSEADQLISAMAAFSPTESPTNFTPVTLASVASGLTLAAAN